MEKKPVTDWVTGTQDVMRLADTLNQMDNNVGTASQLQESSESNYSIFQKELIDILLPMEQFKKYSRD